MFVSVDTMKIWAWIVCRQNGFIQLKLRRRTLRIIHWSLIFYSIDEESLCKILKIYDNECAEILILILSLEMENIFNLSKHLVVIWKFLKYWNNIVTMVVKTKLEKMIQFFIVKRQQWSAVLVKSQLNLFYSK